MSTKKQQDFQEIRQHPSNINLFKEDNLIYNDSPLTSESNQNQYCLDSLPQKQIMNNKDSTPQDFNYTNEANDQHILFTNMVITQQDEEKQNSKEDINVKQSINQSQNSKSDKSNKMNSLQENCECDQKNEYNPCLHINFDSHQFSQQSLQMKSSQKNTEVNLFNNNECAINPLQIEKKNHQTSNSQDYSRDKQPYLRQIQKINEENQFNQLSQQQLSQSPHMSKFNKDLGLYHLQKFQKQIVQKISKVYPTNLYNRLSSIRNQYSSKSQTLFRQLGIMLKIKKKLMNIINQKLSALSQQERMLIGDQSDTNYQNINLELKKKNYVQEIISFKFHPNSFPIILFKVCLLFITLYNIVFVPLILGFELDATGVYALIQQSTGFIYIVEVFIKFRTSLSDKGEIISQSQVIAKKYLNSDFFIDVISILGCVLTPVDQYFALLILFRIVNLIKYLNDLNLHFYLDERYHNIWVLTRLLCFIFLFAHFFACIFHYIGILHLNDPSEKTWIEVLKIQDLNWEVRYNYALYFSFITCITIGYGDITPQNSHERIAVIIFSLSSTVCFSFSVNTIGNIFQDFFIKFQKQYLMRYNAINFMNNREITKDLQLRVLKYIDYIHEMERISPEKGLSIINQISSDLKSQVFEEYYGSILSKSKIFSLNYSISSRKKIASKFQEKLFAPGEIIFEQGEQDNHLYFLIKGEIEFFLHNNGGTKRSQIQTIVTLNKDEFFGYKGFISGTQREMSCKSQNISHVFYISRNDFISILKEDPTDYEQFCKLRDLYLHYTQSLGEKCFGCKSFGHTITQCPRIHLVRNRELIALRYSYSAFQERVYTHRNSIKYSSVKNVVDVTKNALLIKKSIVINMYKQYINNDRNILDEIALLEQIPQSDIQQEFPFLKFVNNEIILCNSDSEESYSSSQGCTSSSDNDNDDDHYNNGEGGRVKGNQTIKEIDESISYKSGDSGTEIQSNNPSQKELKYEIIQNETIFKQQNEDQDWFQNKQEEAQKNNFFGCKKDINKVTENEKVESEKIDEISNEFDATLQQNLIFIENESKQEVDDQTLEILNQRCFNQLPKLNVITPNNSKKEKMFVKSSRNNNFTIKNVQSKFKEQYNGCSKQRSSICDRLKMSNMLGNSQNLIDNQKLYPIDMAQSQLQVKSQINNNYKISSSTEINFMNNRRSTKLSICLKPNECNKLDTNRYSKFQQEHSSPLKLPQAKKSILNIFDNKNSSSSSQSSTNKQISFNQNNKDYQQPKDSIFKLYESQNHILQEILKNVTYNQSKKNKIEKSCKEIEEFVYQTSRMITSDNNIPYNDPIDNKKQYQQPIKYSLANQIQRNPNQLKDLFLFDFDYIKDFKNYFPHNNAELVCNLFNKKQEQKLRRYYFRKDQTNNRHNIDLKQNQISSVRIGSFI